MNRKVASIPKKKPPEPQVEPGSEQVYGNKPPSAYTSD